ncbi:MAG: GAF domain-containing protein [Rhodothermales bacterium]|nr:GAF domain-containing protein [Rhodothermales bacterium]
MLSERQRLQSSTENRDDRYVRVLAAIQALLDGETDWIAAMATTACELHNSFDHFNWTGFYRAVSSDTLVIGPYQGGHGCLRISFGQGVCGAAARERVTQLVPDVDAFPGHIACSSTTRSEIVVPILTPDGQLLGVLDVDSDSPDAFNEIDRRHLETLCADLGARYSDQAIAVRA